MKKAILFLVLLCGCALPSGKTDGSVESDSVVVDSVETPQDTIKT